MRTGWVAAVGVVVAVLVGGWLLLPERVSAEASAAGRLGPDYVDAVAVARALPAEEPVPGAATGSYSWDCGRNEQGHRNSGNVVVTPGRDGPAHHVHDYVGNLATDSRSTVAGLAGRATSCGNGDASSYYWPVLRIVAEGQDGHDGVVQVPVSVTLTYLGNARGPVLAMPRELRGAVGDAVAYTNGGARARPGWTCSAVPGSRTAFYPVCPPGQLVLRVFDFPSCWDGRRVDSDDHRDQLVFPAAGGGCPAGRFAVPRLRIVAAYDIAPGTRYRIDAFDGQADSPVTDHAFLVNLMPEPLMAEVAGCLNTGRVCTAPGGTPLTTATSAGR